MNVKKVLIGLAIAAVALVVILFGGGMLIDGHVDLETEATITAPPHVTHALVADPAGVIKWWQGAAKHEGSEAMADMTVRQGEGPATGPGATVMFEMNGKVAEKWTLLSVTDAAHATDDQPLEAVWEVDFQMFVVKRTLQMKPAPDGKTNMRWQDTGDFQSPLMRWFSLMPPDSILQNFQNAMKLLDENVQVELTARVAAAKTSTATVDAEVD